MRGLVKTGLGALALFAASAVSASAECFIFFCIPVGGDNTPHAPEIDLTQGGAAIVALICAGLIVRERFLRTKKTAA